MFVLCFGIIFSIGISSALADSICYPGDSSKICFGSRTLGEVQQDSTAYGYRDPLKSSDFSKKQNPKQYVKPKRLLDLYSLSGHVKISKNFSVDELLSSEKGRYGYFSHAVIDRLEKIRRAAKGQLIINSAFRSPGYNSDIDGSAKWSRHTYGDAVDIIAPTLSLKGLKNQCLRQGASFVLLYTAHAHCDWRNSTLDPNFYSREEAQSSANLVEPEIAVTLRQTMRRNRLELWTNVVLKEEDHEGDLLHEWKIKTPSGKIIQTLDLKPTVPIEKGLYKVKVEVGSYVQLETEINL